jgi:voltage-gated potassium channel
MKAAWDLLAAALHSRRFIWLLAVPVLLVLTGTLGYYLIEKDYTLFDALYMTVITLSTIGYGEVHELSTAGRVFTIFLILGGVFTLFYAASEVIRAVVGGQIQDTLGRRRMERNLAELLNHLIVCGFGRMGKLVCQEFAAQRLPFVVIDRSPDVLEGFDLAGGIPIHGDATADDILRRAGIDRARALVSVVASDADNLYITMSARLLNEKLTIVSRAADAGSEEKLRRAGANRVVSPYRIGGIRVAQAVLRPTVVDFIELATRTQHVELQLEETQISQRSPLTGKPLKESQIRQELGIIVVAIKKTSGKMVFNPSPEAVLEAGDIVVAMGDRQHLDRLEVLARA